MLLTDFSWKLPGSPFSVSVVIAVKNGDDTIRRAISSVLAQTNPALEVVVIDDSSTDDTRRVVDSFGDLVIVLGGPGRGVAAARNLGIERARGSWVAFLDGDDHWKPSLLELASERIRLAPDAVACFCAAEPADEAGRVIGSHRMRADVTLRELVLGRIVPTTSATLVRRGPALQCGGFFEELKRPAGVEDLDLWWRLAAAGRCLGVPHTAATYIVHDERDCRRSEAEIADLEHDRELVVDRLEKRGEADDLVNRARAVMRARTARYWLRASQVRHARAAACGSLRSALTAEGLITLALAILPGSIRRVTIKARRRIRARGRQT